MNIEPVRKAFSQYEMLLTTLKGLTKFKNSLCLNCRIVALQTRSFSQEFENEYSDGQKEKILRVINNNDADTLSGYDVTKGRIKKFSQWKTSNGQVKNLADVELIEGFSEKSAKKLFDSILVGPMERVEKVPNKIKGRVLQPHLSETLRQSCKSVLSLHIAINSICWTLIDRSCYEVTEWIYHGIDYPEGKKLTITDILHIAWKITQELPVADAYVMKAEATTLRAAGSDPNNPKVIAVNLQKSQMVAMIVALIRARSHYERVPKAGSGSRDFFLEENVYFLRPNLPYRLYGTLVGNEKVSTDQTVEMILQDTKERSPNNSHVFISESLKDKFRSQKDLQKDMLGHCLLLGLTFMDVCIYRNKESINKLLKKVV